MPRFALMRQTLTAAFGAGALIAAIAAQNGLARPGLLLRGRMAPNAGPLVVRVNSLTPGSSTGRFAPAGASYDHIQGVAAIGGLQAPVAATTSDYPSPVDQTMIEQSNHARLSQLAQAPAYWISRDPNF